MTPAPCSRVPRVDFRFAKLAAARAVSSVGRAPARQAGGHWFEPSTAHLDGSPAQWRFASLTSPRPPAGGRVMRLAGSIGLLLVAP